MNIESQLPEGFDDMSDKDKVRELKSLIQEIDENSDAGAVKKRIVEEMIREYSG